MILLVSSDDVHADASAARMFARLRRDAERDRRATVWSFSSVVETEKCSLHFHTAWPNPLLRCKSSEHAAGRKCRSTSKVGHYCRRVWHSV